MELLEDKTIAEEMGENNESIFFSEMRKRKQHDSLAAIIATRHSELRSAALQEIMAGFKRKHRLEFVATIRGVDFINDSAATRVNTTWYSLESISKRIVLIMGGIDKGNDYTDLKTLVQEKVKAIVCLGKDTSKINKAFYDDTDFIINTFSMQEAVSMAHHFAEKGFVVLLSPACASFDLFKNYEDRGAQFEAYVKEL